MTIIVIVAAVLLAALACALLGALARIAVVLVAVAAVVVWAEPDLAGQALHAAKHEAHVLLAAIAR